MTAYEQETVSQVREISDLRGKVKVLQEEVKELKQLVALLVKQIENLHTCMNCVMEMV